MKIRRSGWVYRMAYPEWCSDYQPDRLSLCSLFWRLLAMILIVHLIIVSVLQIIGFFFAHKVNFSNSRKLYEPYESWPEIRGHRVWPISILALAGSILILVNASEVAIACGKIIAVVVGLTTIALGITFFITGGIPAVRKNEAVRVAVEYVKAKKQKVCPLVKVVD